jgi:hypothetical protein
VELQVAASADPTAKIIPELLFLRHLLFAFFIPFA